MTAFSTAFSSKPSRLDFFSTPKSAEQGGVARGGMGLAHQGTSWKNKSWCHAHTLITLMGDGNKVGAGRERLRILFFSVGLLSLGGIMRVHAASRAKRSCDGGIARIS